MGDRCAAFLQKKRVGGACQEHSTAKGRSSFKGLKASGNYMYHVLRTQWLYDFIVIPTINTKYFLK
jgi:hypothetical protein